MTEGANQGDSSGTDNLKVQANLEIPTAAAKIHHGKDILDQEQEGSDEPLILTSNEPPSIESPAQDREDATAVVRD